jgi:hypothetical protein
MLSGNKPNNSKDTKDLWERKTGTYVCVCQWKCEIRGKYKEGKDGESGEELMMCKQPHDKGLDLRVNICLENTEQARLSNVESE